MTTKTDTLEDVAAKMRSASAIPSQEFDYTYHFSNTEFRIMPIPKGLKGHLNTGNNFLAIIESINGHLPGVDMTQQDVDSEVFAVLQDLFVENMVTPYFPKYLTARIEPKAPRQNPENPNSEKQLFPIDDHSQENLIGIIRRGYQRLLTPAEHFEIKFAGVEGTLPRSIIPIYHDMMDSYGESLGLIRVSTKDEKRFVTTHNKIKDRRYDTETPDFEPIEIGNLHDWINLDQLPSQLIKQLYGRDLKHFPEQVRKGQTIILPDRQSRNREVKLYKPAIWISQGDFVGSVGCDNGDYGFDLSDYIYDRSSRGYVEKNISTGNQG